MSKTSGFLHGILPTDQEEPTSLVANWIRNNNFNNTHNSVSDEEINSNNISYDDNVNDTDASDYMKSADLFEHYKEEILKIRLNSSTSDNGERKIIGKIDSIETVMRNLETLFKLYPHPMMATNFIQKYEEKFGQLKIKFYGWNSIIHMINGLPMLLRRDYSEYTNDVIVCDARQEIGIIRVPFDVQVRVSIVLLENPFGLYINTFVKLYKLRFNEELNAKECGAKDLYELLFSLDNMAEFSIGDNGEYFIRKKEMSSFKPWLYGLGIE